MAIEALDIEIRHKAEGGNDVVEHLIDSLGRLKNTLNGVASAIRFPMKASEGIRAVEQTTAAVTRKGSAAVASAKKESASLEALNMRYQQIMQRIDRYKQMVDDMKVWEAEHGPTESSIDTRIEALTRLQELTNDRYDVEAQLSAATAASSAATAGAASAESAAADAGNQLADANERVAKSTKSAGDEEQKHSAVLRVLQNEYKRVRKNISAVTRMAMYRAIRSAIRMLSASVSEGVKNLAEFDRATGQTTTAGAIKTISAYQQQFLQLKNAVGAAAMPIMQVLLPVVQTIAGWFITAANAVNQLVRALQGFSTFMQAGTADGYDYADSMSAAGGAAGKLKNTILGFDELNVMNGQNGGGGGGGSGNWGGLSAVDLFGETGISQSILDFAASLRLTVTDIFSDWGSWNPERLAEALIAGAAAVLGGIIGFSLGGVGGALIGIAIGASLGLSLDALVFNHDGKISDAEAANVVAAALAVIFGGAVGGVLGGGIGIVIGASVGLALTLTGVIAERAQKKKLLDQFYATPVGKEVLALTEKIKEAASVAAEISINIKNREEAKENLSFIEGKAKSIVDEIVILNNKDFLTPSQVSRMRGLLDQLNAMGLDGLESSYNDATGKINLTEAAIRGVIRAQMDMAKLETYMDLYKQALADQLKIEQQLESAKKAEAELARKVAAKEAEIEGIKARQREIQSQINAAYSTYRQQGYSESEAMNKALNDYWGASLKVQRELEAANAELEELNKRHGEAVKTVNALEGEWRDVQGEIDYYSGKVDELESTKLTLEFEAKVPSVGPITTTLWFQPKLKNTSINVAVSDNGNNSTYHTISFARAAEGGFVGPGQLFIAREAGPEMVGTMGGRTAVANNDQIVAGIASGVAAAMLGTGAKLDETNDLLRGIAEKDGTVVVSTSEIAAGLTRMNRRAGATVIPVGA